MLYVGVTDPLGGINQLFPLFGISNQLLAAIALTLVRDAAAQARQGEVGLGARHRLAWDLIVTMTASWQKVFSDDPKIGYFEPAVDLPGGASTTARCWRRRPTWTRCSRSSPTRRSTASLQAIFALLTLIVVVSTRS